MLNLLIVLFTAGLILLCGFLTLVILMQKSSGNAGMGSALGGGAAESAFGGQTSSVLSKATIYSIAGFFVLVFCLYLAHMARANESEQDLAILNPEELTSEEASSDLPALDAMPFEELEQSTNQLMDEADQMVQETDELLEGTTAEASQQVETAAEQVAETMTTVEEKVGEEATSETEPAPAEKTEQPSGNQ